MVEPSKPKKRTTFYFEPNLHNEFKEICRREGIPMTQKHEEWERHYVQLHKEGNPQQMLEVFLPEKAKARVLCNWLDGSRQGEVHCRKKGMWIDAKQCYGCKNNRLRKTK